MTILSDATKNQLRASLEADQTTWGRVPLKVAIMLFSEGENAYRSPVKRALEWWNKKLGFQVFVECDVLDENWDCDIMFMSGTDGHMAVAWHETINGRLVGHIEIRGPQDIQTMQGLVAHELGHILGLPHCEGTIMSATMEPALMGDWFDYRGEMKRDDRDLADFQRKRLRKKYHDVPENLADLASDIKDALTNEPGTTVEVEPPAKK